MRSIPPLTTWQRRFLFGAILIAPLVTSFESAGTTYINVDIRHDLSLTFATMQWLSTGYWIFAISFMVIFGRIGDIRGRVKLELFGLLLYLAGTILASIGTGVWVILLGRVLQGLGTAALIPNALSLLKIIYPEEKQTKMFLVWAGVNYGGYGLAPFFAGLFALADWRLLYWIVLPFIVYAMLVFAFFWNIDRDTLRKVPLDYLGTFLLIVTLVTFTLVFSEAMFWGWTSASIITLYSVCAVFFVLLLISQAFVAHPILPVRMLQFRSFWTGLVIELSAYFCLIVITYFYSLYTQSFFGKNYNTLQAGVTILPATSLMLLGIFIPRRFIAWCGYKILFLMGELCFLAGFLTLFFLMPQTGYVNIWWRLLLCGIGALFTITINISWAMRDVPAQNASQGSGTLETMDRLGSLLGVGLGSVWYVETLIRETQSRLNAAGFPHLSAQQIELFYTSSHRAMPPFQLATFQTIVTHAFNNTMMLGVIGIAIAFLVTIFFIPWSATPK